MCNSLAIGYHRDGEHGEAEGAREECRKHTCGDASTNLVGEVVVYIQEHYDTYRKACDAGDGGIGLCVGAQPAVPDALAHAGGSHVDAQHHEHGHGQKARKARLYMLGSRPIVLGIIDDRSYIVFRRSEISK